MNLHSEYPNEFNALIKLTSEYKNIDSKNIKRDYYICLVLEQLSKSEFKDKVVFKGGTSLSKCFPNTIERFSEDIDLTYLGMEEEDKICEKHLKQLISSITAGMNIFKIPGEGNQRSKSRNVEVDENEYIKLEIGSSVKPDPYGKRKVKTYIQEYLEYINKPELIDKYELKEIELLVLDVRRTFIDKVMSIKRHTICKTLVPKVRHIYDVYKLYQLKEIHDFLKDKEQLKKILVLTKNTDAYYMNKRNIAKEYSALGNYDYDSWKYLWDDEIKKAYKKLSVNILFNHTDPDFNLAVKTFEEINKIFESIGE